MKIVIKTTSLLFEFYKINCLIKKDTHDIITEAKVLDEDLSEFYANITPIAIVGLESFYNFKTIGKYLNKSFWLIL